MFNRRRLWIAAAALVLLCASEAEAQIVSRNCADRDTLVSRLAASYAEVPVSRALSAKGTLVEVLLSPNGTWTLIATRAGNVACIVGTGRNWQFVAPSEDPGAAS